MSGCARRRSLTLRSHHLGDRLARPKLGRADRLVFESVPSVDGRSVVQIFTRRSTKRGGKRPRPSNALSGRGRRRPTNRKGVRDVITNSRVLPPTNELPSVCPYITCPSFLPPADEQNHPSFEEEFRSRQAKVYLVGRPGRGRGRTEFRFIGFISRCSNANAKEGQGDEGGRRGG